MRNNHRNSGMNLTSIGYHTFNIFHKLTVYEGDTILNDACDCQKNTNEIRVRPLIRNDDDWDSDEFTEKLKSGSRYFLIEVIVIIVGVFVGSIIAEYIDRKRRK